MPKFRPGQSGNPLGRPKSASGLRELLIREFGPDAGGLVDQLKALSHSKNQRVALAAVQTLLGYHAGPPQHSISVDVQATTTRRLTPEMLALMTTEELRTVYAIAQRFGLEDDGDRLLPPDPPDRSE
jgi:hypothetical protein